ncbi:hypothetical protein EJ02DRAFT_450038 [Clathrospora elynae]|uniref:Uncharacterized protein n=1 Tax=Clathrospora elynae TaxID=706981 RepID=A0A6A5T5R4_9PLEO|nr:hypothetical protein EJ02DRAFT_450038 [Clathrospora elynae]
MRQSSRLAPLSAGSSAGVYHLSAARTLSQASFAYGSSSQSQSSVASESLIASVEPVEIPDREAYQTQEYPAINSNHRVRGEPFDVDFGRVYCGKTRLEKTRLGYAVQHKSQLS